MKDFRQLKVWEKAHQLTLSSYTATRGFPSEERFGLTSQIRCCSALLPPILRKVAEEVPVASFKDFYRLPWDRHLSWITTFCWPRISGFWIQASIVNWKVKGLKLGACLRRLFAKYTQNVIKVPDLLLTAYCLLPCVKCLLAPNPPPFSSE